MALPKLRKTKTTAPVSEGPSAEVLAQAEAAGLERGDSFSYDNTPPTKASVLPSHDYDREWL